MSLLDYFRRDNSAKSASVARDRLQIVVAHQRAERAPPRWRPSSWAGCRVSCRHRPAHLGAGQVDVLQRHLAQANVARMRAPLDDPLMQGFVDRLVNDMGRDRQAGHHSVDRLITMANQQSNIVP